MCRSRLTDSIHVLTSHLSDVKTRARQLNTMRQSHQNELYGLQQNIRDHSEQIVAQVRQRETTLLTEAQNWFDSALNSDGGGSILAELEFRKSEIEKLIVDIRQLLTDSPLSCLLHFDEIAAKVCRLTDASLNNVGASSSRLRMPKPLRFVPLSLFDMNIIGCLQDCSVSTDTMDADEPQSPSTTSSPPHDNPSSVTRERFLFISPRRSYRMKSVDEFLFISPRRSYRMKSVARLHTSLGHGGGGSDGSIVAASSTVPDAPTSATADTASFSGNVSSASSADTPGTSTASASTSPVMFSGSTSQARILFTVDKVLYISPAGTVRSS